GNVRAQGAIALESNDTSSLQAQIERLNLTRITEALNQEVRIASTASGSVNATWPGRNFRRASGRASLRLAKLVPTAARNLLPIEGNVEAVARNGFLTLNIGDPSLDPKSLAALRFLHGRLQALLGATPVPILQSTVQAQDKSSFHLVARKIQDAVSSVRRKLTDAVELPPKQRPFRLLPAAFGTVSKNPLLLGARLNVSPRLLRALFAFAQTEGATPQSLRALEVLATRLRGQVNITPEGALSGTLRATVDDVQQLLVELAGFQGKSESLLPMPVRGNTNVTAQLGGTLERPTAEITLAAPALAVGELKNVALDLSAHYGPSQLLIHQAVLTLEQQPLANISGSIGLGGASPALDLNAEVQNLTLASVFAALQKASVPAAGEISLTARVLGTVANPVAEVTVNGTGLEAYGEPWGTLAVSAQLADQVLRMERIELEKTPGQTLSAELSYNLQSKAYTISAQTSGLAIEQLRLPGGQQIQAQLRMNAQGSGTVEDPQLQANLDVTGLTVDQQTFGDIAAVAQVANQSAEVRLQAPRWNTLVTAQAGIRAPYQGAFRVETQNLQVQNLPVVLPEALQKGGLAGSLSFSIEGKGPLETPEQLDVAGQIAQLNFTFYGQSVRSPEPLAFRYANRVLHIDSAAILAGDSRLEIAGSIPLESTGTPADLRIVGNVDLASAVAFVPPPAAGEPSTGAGETTPEATQDAPQEVQERVQPPNGQAPVESAVASADVPPERLTARGQLRIDLRLGGTLRNIVPEGSLNMQDAALAGPSLPAPVEGLTLAATIGDGRVRLEQFTAQVAGGKVQATGVLPLALLPEGLPIASGSSQEGASFSAQIAGLNPAAIAGMNEAVKGTVSISLEARAPNLDINSLDAQLRLDDFRLDIGGIPIGQQGNSLIIARNGLLRLEQLIITGPQTEMVLAGTAGMVVPRELNLQVHGRTNAALAAIFVSDLKIQGVTEVQAEVLGTVAEPQMQGFISMQDGQLALAEPGIALTELKFRLDLSGRQVQVSQFSGVLNGGDLTANGSFNIGAGGIQNPDVRVFADNVYMDFPEGLRSISSLNLHFASQGENLVLGGEVHLQEAFFRRHVVLETELIGYLRSRPDVTLIGERSPFLERLRYSINVDTHSPVVIENNLARTAMNVDLRVVGNYYQPSLLGRVTFEGAGELYLNARTYYIDRGTITFLNENRIEPSVDILARTEAAGYQINMLIQGRGDDVETTLTSDPVLPEPDIVSVLLTGKPLSELRGAAASVVQQQAFSVAAGTVGGVLSQQLQQAIGLSQVSIEPTLIAEEANPSARLTIGQQLAPGLRLVYSMDLTNAGDQIWMGEYNFTRRLLTRVIK
ncbi:MAG: translocation/assembly module TamB domain-containing protein, partial [Candidatus Korobacteraceae bacterium]